MFSAHLTRLVASLQLCKPRFQLLLLDIIYCLSNCSVILSFNMGRPFCIMDRERLHNLQPKRHRRYTETNPIVFISNIIVPRHDRLRNNIKPMATTRGCATIATIKKWRSQSGELDMLSSSEKPSWMHYWHGLCSDAQFV